MQQGFEKRGGGIEISTTVLSIYAMHALLRFCNYLPLLSFTSLASISVANCTMASAHVVHKCIMTRLSSKPHMTRTETFTSCTNESTAFSVFVTAS